MLVCRKQVSYTRAMDARVLVVEDVNELAELMALYLSREGFTVQTAESAELALPLLASFDPDLVLLDINLPGMDGFAFLGKIHAIPCDHRDAQSGSGAPGDELSAGRLVLRRPRVLIVSARDADEDIITGLGYGADEFVTKPFSPRVLVARVCALLRREEELRERASGLPPPASPAHGGERLQGDSISFGPFVLVMRSCMLFNERERIRLSAREFDVLEYLVRHEGMPCSPQDIYSDVWQNAYGDITAVAVYIQRLRRKMEENASQPRWIETIHGMGYRFAREEGPS